MSDARCVIGDKPHAATVGLLCSHHFERIGMLLRDIEDEALRLSAIPSMAMQTGARGASLASHRAPARVNVIVANDPRRGTGIPDNRKPDPWGQDDTASILHTLGTWARVVREERYLSASGPATVTGERDLLTRNLPWIAEQAWVDALHGDLTVLLGQLRTANGTRPDRPYSYCPAVVNGEPCIGQVWIHDETQLVWRRYPDRCARDWEQAPGAAVCDTCGSAWSTPAERARLRRMIDDAATEMTRPRTDDGRPMFTAQEMADSRGVAVSAIRMRLSRLGVKAQHGSYYDPDVLDAPRQNAEAS